MTDSIRPAAGPCQANSDGPPASGQDNLLVLRLVRDAIDDLGWKHDAVAAAMSDASGRKIDGPYLSKMLTSDKPFPLELLPALPDVIERRVAVRYATAFGVIVVEPAESHEAAVRDLVRGIFGVLSPSLPVHAERMAKAGLAPATARKVAR